MRKYFAVLSLAAVFVWLVSSPIDNKRETADSLRGGQQNGCWTLEPMPCPYTSFTCGAIACTSGWTSWYCPSGTFQQTASPGYVRCASVERGADDCYVPNQNVWQVCATRQSCGSSCIMAVAGPGAGTYYCSGPVGPTWAMLAIPVPALGNPGCKPPLMT